MSEPLSIEEARDHFSELVESVTQRRERVTVTTPRGQTVVLLNADDLESLEATIETLNDPEAMADIREGLDAILQGRTDRLEDVYPRDL